MKRLNVAIKFNIVRSQCELKLTVEGEGYFLPARLSGPPEDCCPAEGEACITRVLLEDGSVWTGQLSEEEEERASDMLMDEVIEAWERAQGPELDYGDLYDV